MTASRRFYQRPWFQLSAGILVTAACLAWAFYSLASEDNPETEVREDDPVAVLGQIGDAFKQADYRTLPVMWAIVLVFYCLKAWRWALLLRPVGRYSTRQAFSPVMIGFAFNNLLPAHLGEFVRVYVFSRKHQVNQGAVLSTVVLERIFDILAILGFFFVGLEFTPELDERAQQAAHGFAIFVAAGLIGAAVYLIWTQPVVRVVESLLARIAFLPDVLRQKICRLLEGGAAGLAALKSSWLVTAISLNSISQWALNGVLMHLSLWSFGIEVSPLVSCLLLGVVAFAVTIPSSPGYFGVVQTAFLLVINKETVGVSNEAAVFAASIYYHMVQYLLVTSIGLILFNLTGLSMAEVRESAETQEYATDNRPATSPADCSRSTAQLIAIHTSQQRACNFEQSQSPSEVCSRDQPRPFNANRPVNRATADRPIERLLTDGRAYRRAAC